MENNKQSKLKFTIFTITSLIIIILIAKYITDPNFRTLINIKILNKQVLENSLNSIELNSDDNPISFAYDNYIGVFSKSKLSIYNKKANIENELSLNITNPIVNTTGKYVALAEKDGNRFYIINTTSLLWQNDIDGKIKKIHINSNGYVSIIASSTTYTSIVIVFDADGNELFKTYLPSTYAMCSAISTNNEYIAIGEVDYSGTVIKSNIRIHSMSTAKLIYEYTHENEIITNIKYSNKDTATCMFSNSIVNVNTSNGSKICDITKDISFANINSENKVCIIEKQSSGLFSYEYQLKLISLNSGGESLYIINSKLPKQVIASGKIIALNYGNSVDVINQNGSLKKNYLSTQQIKDVIVGEHIVGVVYKDKIAIIDL